MKSMWLCVDPNASIDLKQTYYSRSSQKPHLQSQNKHAYYGIFSDHPANIGMMLQRPITPFNPPTASFISFRPNEKSEHSLNSSFIQNSPIEAHNQIQRHKNGQISNDISIF